MTFSRTARSGRPVCAAAYMLIEALVYIGVVVLVLGLAYSLAYRLIENSIVLRRSAEDVSAALRAGERWRADLRQATEVSGPHETDTGIVWNLVSPTRTVHYRISGSTLWVQPPEHPWVQLLQNIADCDIRPDPRRHVEAWRLELQLAPRTKGYVKPGRMQPLFTFTSVPRGQPTL